jgi:hypothetical protein
MYRCTAREVVRVISFECCVMFDGGRDVAVVCRNQSRSSLRISSSRMTGCVVVAIRIDVCLFVSARGFGAGPNVD